jgi:hypothetical protein
MLGAACDCEWLQIVLMLSLWTAAVGATYLLVPPQEAKSPSAIFLSRWNHL